MPCSAPPRATRPAVRHASPWLALVLPLLAPLPSAAQPKPPQQVVKPPVAQLWMDVATSTMPGMPDLSGMAGMPGIGGLFGGRGGAAGGNNAFGNTRSMMPGRYVDIAFVTQRKPAGTEVTQAVPAGTGLAPSVPLLPFKTEPAPPPGPRGPREYREPTESEPPKGRILFYWGCSETVRPGQPRVLDFSKGPSAEWAGFMQGRAPRERGALARPGHSLWPNERDRRSFGREASLTGEHALSGDGVPADLRFTLAAAQDFMPPIALQQAGEPRDVLRLSWQALPHARAYFLNAMSGGQDGDATEMVLWSSAEVPDVGMGLMDYASPGNIEQWLREKVLLAPAVTQCAIPKGIFAKGEGGMLRMIAYGPELNLAHPPRPTDVKIPWEPDWAVRVRTKSTVMAMLGMEAEGSRSGAAPGARGEATGQAAGAARPDCPPPKSAGSDPSRTGAEVGGALFGGLGRAVGGAVTGALGALGGKKQEPANPPADCPR